MLEYLFYLLSFLGFLSLPTLVFTPRKNAALKGICFVLWVLLMFSAPNIDLVYCVDTGSVATSGCGTSTVVNEPLFYFYMLINLLILLQLIYDYTGE